MGHLFILFYLFIFIYFVPAKPEAKLLSSVSTVLFAPPRLCFPRACLPPGVRVPRHECGTKRKPDKKM